MLNKSKVKSATGVNENRRKKSAASSNLRVSPSLIGKFRSFAKRKQKSHYSKSAAADEEERASSGNDNARSEQRNPQKDNRIASILPEDAAVHFGRFYGVEDANKPKAGRVKTSSEPNAVPYCRVTPRLEFTRQMVQKLERTAGTEEYARQVSALLEETVEPAHFKLHSMPTENSIPDGRHNPTGFPLWYKEPFKTPLASDEVYKLLKEKFDNAERKAKDIFDEEASENNSLDEWPGENESLPDNEEERRDTLAREKSSMHLLSNGSSSVTEAKDTDSRESNETSSSSDGKPTRKVQFLQSR